MTGTPEYASFAFIFARVWRIADLCAQGYSPYVSRAKETTADAAIALSVARRVHLAGTPCPGLCGPMHDDTRVRTENN